MGEDLLPREPVRPLPPGDDLGVHATSRPRARQKLVCPFCHDLLGAVGNVSCPGEACGATYHNVCWKECVDHYGGCAVYGCKGARARANEANAPGVAASPRRRSLVVGLAGTLLAMVVGVSVSRFVNRSPREVAQGRPTSAQGPAPADSTARPTTAQEWLELASAKFNAYDHKAAIAAATEALKLLPPRTRTTPQTAWAFSLRGLAFAWEKDFVRAFPDLDVAIQLAPLPAYYKNRAVANELRGDHAGCVRDCEKFLELAPNDPEAGLVRSKLVEHRSALEAEHR